MRLGLRNSFSSATLSSTLKVVRSQPFLGLITLLSITAVEGIERSRFGIWTKKLEAVWSSSLGVVVPGLRVLASCTPVSASRFCQGFVLMPWADFFQFSVPWPYLLAGQSSELSEPSSRMSVWGRTPSQTLVARQASFFVVLSLCSWRAMPCRLVLAQPQSSSTGPRF